MHKYIDIIELMQIQIDKITAEEWKSDECPPKFVLSVMGYDEEAKMALTIEHMGYRFTEVIFPCKGIVYNNGFNIYDEMRQLYNRTM